MGPEGQPQRTQRAQRFFTTDFTDKADEYGPNKILAEMSELDGKQCKERKD